MERTFVEILCSMKHPFKRQAYELAGYKCRGKTAEVEAARTLRKPRVSRYYNLLNVRATEEAAVTASEVIRELATLGFSNLSDYLQLNEDGTLTIYNWDKIGKQKLSAVASVKIRTTTTTDKKDNTKYTTTSTEVKLHDKNEALRDLGRHLGIFQKNNEQQKGYTMQDLILMFMGKEASG